MPGTDRQTDIDTLRALACIALVSFHVVGTSSGSGLELPREHPLVQAGAVLTDLRMPLFSFLSGLVFVAARPGVAPADWLRRQAARKARRLLLPMLAVGTLFWCARYLHGVPQMPLWQIAVLPHAHFWFLQATFALMMALLALVWLTGGRVGPAALILGCGGGLAWLAGLRVPGDVLGLSGALRLAVFFAAGVLAARTDWRGGGSGLRLLGGGLLAAALALSLWRVFGSGALPPGLRPLLALACGLAGCLGLLLIRPAHAGLARLGQGSYAIYLFHVFFTAGVTEALRHAAPGLPPAAVWPLALAAGLAGPLAVQAAARRHPATAWALLGLAWRAAPLATARARPRPVLPGT